jgi:hypothetical protein
MHEWNAHQCDKNRDVVQLFTDEAGTAGQTGLANLGAACTLDLAYSIIKPESYEGDLAKQTALSAHELGHNWGAIHCAQTACTGNCGIMASALNGSLTSFDQCSKHAINPMITAVLSHGGCLDTATPYPALEIEALCQDAPSPCANNPTALVPAHKIYLKGFGVTGATSVTIGGSVTVPEAALSISYGDNNLSFDAPLPPTLGVNSVQMANSCGTSHAATIEYFEPSAPILDAPTQTSKGASFTWAFAGKVNHNSFLLIAADPASTHLENGWPVMSGATILTSGQLSSIGYGSYSITIPEGYANTYFDSQVVTYTSGQGVSGSSNIVVTFVFF